MLLRSICASFVLCALAVPSARADDGDPARRAACAVWARERSFADSVARHDTAAFADHVDPDAVFDAAGDAPTRGRDAVVAAWRRVIAGEGVTLAWYPEHTAAGNGAAARVAWSSGPFLMTVDDGKGGTRRVVGTYRSVWRLGDDGRWRVLYDAGGDDRHAASDDDVTRFDAGNRAECPGN